MYGSKRTRAKVLRSRQKGGDRRDEGGGNGEKSLIKSTTTLHGY